MHSNPALKSSVCVIRSFKSTFKQCQLNFNSECFNSSTRKGRNSVTFAETIATAGVDNAGLSLTTPEQGVLDYPNWLTALEPPRYQHSLITTTRHQLYTYFHAYTHKYSKVKGTVQEVSLSSDAVVRFEIKLDSP